MGQTLHTSQTTAIKRSHNTLLFAIENRRVQMSLLLCDSLGLSIHLKTPNNVEQIDSTIISQQKNTLDRKRELHNPID
jgi:hypothetical protein